MKSFFVIVLAGLLMLVDVAVTAGAASFLFTSAPVFREIGTALGIAGLTFGDWFLGLLIFLGVALVLTGISALIKTLMKAL